MDLADFREYCLTKPNVNESMPFGPDTLVFKVGGRIFAIASLDDVPPQVNLKCDPESALDLRDRYEEVRPGYHMNKKHWNTIELSGRIPPNDLHEWIDHSYELVLASLPKRVVTHLGKPDLGFACVTGKLCQVSVAPAASARPRRARAAKPAGRPRGRHRAGR